MTKLKAIERYQDSELKRVVSVGEIITVKNPQRVKLLINAGKCEKMTEDTLPIEADGSLKPKRGRRKKND